MVGPTRYGWFRLHAGNALLAQVGSPSHTMPYPQSLLFPFDSRIERTSVLLEFHRYRWGSDSVGDEVGPVEGGVFVGDSTALADQLELARRRRMMADLVPLLLATIFVVAGLYHLELYVRRRTQSAYLWFGLATLALAGNTIIYTSWVAETSGWLTVPWRLNEAFGHLATACLIQFLWEVLDRPVGRALRLYQWSHVALAAALVALPFPWVFDTTGFRTPWTWPLLLVAGWVLVQEARRGHPEAKVLVVGGGVLMGTVALDLIRGMVPGDPPSASLLWVRGSAHCHGHVSRTSLRARAQ